MTKQELIALGVPEEAADKVVKALEGYVPASELEAAKKAEGELQKQMKERDKQLEELKKVDAAGLQAEIVRLQGENAQAAEVHQAEMSRLQKQNALSMALRDTAHDPADIIALLNLEDVKLDGNGALRGSVDDLVKPIKESKPYLFREPETAAKPELRGVTPAQPGVVADPNLNMTEQVYTSMGMELPK